MEHTALEFGLSGSGWIRTELPAVEHQVVGQGANGQRVGLDLVEVVRMRVVNGWWPGFGRPVSLSTPTNNGNSATHTYRYGPWWTGGRAISLRSVPSTSHVVIH